MFYETSYHGYVFRHFSDHLHDIQIHKPKTKIESSFLYLTFRWPCIVVNSYNKTNYQHQFLKLIFTIKLYMFRTIPLSIIRDFPLYSQQWYMSYILPAGSGLNCLDPAARKVSVSLYDIYHCCVHSEKLLMVGRGNVRHMLNFITKINLRN